MFSVFPCHFSLCVLFFLYQTFRSQYFPEFCHLSHYCLSIFLPVLFTELKLTLLLITYASIAQISLLNSNVIHPSAYSHLSSAVPQNQHIQKTLSYLWASSSPWRKQNKYSTNTYFIMLESGPTIKARSMKLKPEYLLWFDSVCSIVSFRFHLLNVYQVCLSPF